VQNEATTVAGSGRNITVTRRHGTNTIVVSGTIGAGAAAGSNYRTVDEPTLYAASIFRAALARHGVTISKPTTLTGSAPTSAATVTSRDSMTLEQLLPYFLKLSNNGHAELLVKAMGRKASNTGTAAAGIAAIRSFLARTGVEPAKVRLADGAGLSRQDLVSPEQVTALLVGARSKPWFTTWYNALPIAGNSDKMIGGTLASRMGGTAAANNVHGKTGTLTGVSALSGFVTTAGGQKLVFSILLNQFLGDSAPKSIEDTIAVALANSGGAAAATHRDLARLKAPRAIKDDPSTPVDERALECSWLKSC
jgi:D-alanyl-D-alanine carboxypeptidase/D-alanyl-D-alanine-endopeptidase (penicillin-binding protein 4)